VHSPHRIGSLTLLSAARLRLERRLGRITAPTLVAAPADDRLIPVAHAQRYEDLLANGLAVVGSAAAVADRLADLYEKLGGFGQLIGLFAIGPSTHQQVMRSSELFASDVMPALRPLGVTAERTTA
jgi:alkanesulfonate monooxygenase SsuD/methylene tetrahydromethanopterin reductase-like flavin-dependent oxidoreductase (luciferase family)